MDEKILDAIKKNLAEEKARLEKELGGFSEKDAGISDNYKSEFPSFGESDEENAAEVAEYSDRLSIEHALENQLRDVNKALASIAAGKYGLCKYCGQPIEEKRLLARPTSGSCVACKKKLTGEA